MTNKEAFLSESGYTGSTSVVSATLPDELIKNLDFIAEDTGCDRNKIIMHCLEFAIEHIEADTTLLSGVDKKERLV